MIFPALSKKSPIIGALWLLGWGHKKIAHGQYGRRPNKYYWVGNVKAASIKITIYSKDVSSILKVLEDWN